MTRKPIILASIAAILVVCLVPPWRVYHENAYARTAASLSRIEGSRPLPYVGDWQTRYRFVFADPEWKRGDDEYKGAVRVGRLLAQVLIVVVVSGALAYFAGERKDEYEEDDQFAR